MTMSEATQWNDFLVREFGRRQHVRFNYTFRRFVLDQPATLPLLLVEILR